MLSDLKLLFTSSGFFFNGFLTATLGPLRALAAATDRCHPFRVPPRPTRLLCHEARRSVPGALLPVLSRLPPGPSGQWRSAASRLVHPLAPCASFTAATTACVRCLLGWELRKGRGFLSSSQGLSTCPGPRWAFPDGPIAKGVWVSPAYVSSAKTC